MLLYLLYNTPTYICKSGGIDVRGKKAASENRIFLLFFRFFG